MNKICFKKLNIPMLKLLKTSNRIISVQQSIQTITIVFENEIIYAFTYYYISQKIWLRIVTSHVHRHSTNINRIIRILLCVLPFSHFSRNTVFQRESLICSYTDVQLMPLHPYNVIQFQHVRNRVFFQFKSIL